MAGPSTVQPKNKRHCYANKTTDDSASFSSSSSDQKSQPEDSSSTSSDLTVSTSHTIETSDRNPESTTTSNNEDEPGSSTGARRKTSTAATAATRLHRFSGRNYRQKQQAATDVTSETDEELEDIFNKCLSKDDPCDAPVNDEIAQPAAETSLVDENVIVDEITTASATSPDSSAPSEASNASEEQSLRRHIEPFVIAVTSNTDDEVSWVRLTLFASKAF